MKTVLYARVSTEDQVPENQFKDLKAKAETLGQPYDLFEEKESSAKTRPIKDDILKRIRKGEYNIVVVWMMDRFCRNTLEFMTNVDEFRKLGVRFIAIKENIDTGNKSTPFDTFNSTIRSAISQLERELGVLRTKEGMRIAKEKGKPYHRPKGAKDKKPRRKFGYFRRWEQYRRLKKGGGRILESGALEQSPVIQELNKDPLV